MEYSGRDYKASAKGNQSHLNFPLFSKLLQTFWNVVELSDTF